MKAVLLNGPPGCGKDTIGSLLYGGLSGSQLLKFAQPIIDYMLDTFAVSCTDGHDKEAPCADLNGLSRRQVAIAYSEEWIKPHFGRGWFGLRAVQEMMAMDSGTRDIYIFTDSGFLEESKVVVNALGISNVMQVKVHRPGYHFNNDSRSYWHIPELETIHFDNDCTLPELFNVVRHNLLPEIRKWSQH